MTPLTRVLLLAALVLSPLAHAASYLRVVSWNLRHEGWSGETNYAGDAQQIWNQFGSSSTSTNGCDVVFLQEVMYDTAASGIASALTSLSGVQWSYAVTAAVGRSSYKERYAVVYRTDTVTLLSSALYADSGDRFEREPQIVKLRQNATGEDYTFINWHTVFGTTTERAQEIADIDLVFNSVQSGSSSDQDVFLVGDHNASATHSWWTDFKSKVSGVTYAVNELTSLNSTGGYVSAYDHFWYQGSYVTEYSSSGRDYVSNTKSFYDGLSDHAPIWLRLYSSGSTD
ncbi:MAG TPA: endonuclease/exonuclease/phosphatase family protein [Aggregicoccus sp.]|nr:endonuclease/exonuclease/phosphatase family protein [Aggregicoccus sp.]